MITALPVDISTSIKRALEEDIGSGDATTDSIVPPGAVLRGLIVAKQAGVIAGLEVAEAVFHEIDDHVSFNALVEDGATVSNRTTIAEVNGSARALLTGERAALNFLG